MEVKYTLCFVEKDNKYLMLNRIKKPNMGMWNGLGGKIEDNEDKFESVKREVLEESGLKVTKLNYHGEVYWHSANFNGGLYVFTASTSQSLTSPINMDEGILHWQDIDWVLDKNNNGVVSNIPIFMREILKSNKKLKFDFYYDKQGSIKEYKVEELKS